MINYCKHIKQYKNEGNTIKPSIINYTKIITIKNTPIHDLQNTYKEYQQTLNEENNEVQKYIKWLVKQYENIP